MKKPAVKLNRRSALIMAGGLLILVALATYSYRNASLSDTAYTVPTMSQGEIDARKSRIVAIYDSLGLSDQYVRMSEDVFGEKRVYSWDPGRSFSSARTYVRQADVEATVAELRPKIEAAGFTFVDEPYPNAVDVQLHFKSAKGEYVRLTVSSKPREDALRKASADKLEPNYSALPYREAPANVMIKVNLDDNNE